MSRFGKRTIQKQDLQTPEVQENKPAMNEDGTVDTELYIHPDWDISSAETYVYKFRHQQLDKLLPNQLSIQGIELFKAEDDLIVEVFLRNTLSKGVRLEAADLLLLNEEGNVLAKKRFELDEVSEIPAMSCMPWRFLFEKQDRTDEDIPETGWKIAFELKNKEEAPEHQLDLEPSWEEQLSSQQRKQLEELTASLPALSQGEINLTGIEAKFNEEGALAVVMLIRNGNAQNIKLESIPLVVEDAAGDIVCQGGFKLENFEVKAHSSKPWSFVFPPALIQKQEPDFSRWKAYAPAAKAQA